MTKLYKTALLAALGISSITAAQASTDLLLGFTDNNSGISSAQNDYVIDLGMTTATLVADATANGGTYDLSSLFNAATFSTAFGADASALNSVNAGVVGGYTGSNPKLLFQTSALGFGPAALTAGSQVNNAANAAQGVAVGEYASANASGWTSLVAYNTTQGGTTPSGNTVYGDTGTSPVGTLSGGVLSMDLWGNSRATSFGSAGSWAYDGTFTINLNTDSVMFSTTPVPEPSTCSLFGGAGLLVLLFRRKLNRKNA
jgi:PAB1-binding protein PBP1